MTAGDVVHRLMRMLRGRYRPSGADRMRSVRHGGCAESSQGRSGSTGVTASICTATPPRGSTGERQWRYSAFVPKYSGPAELIPEGGGDAYKVTAHLRTGKSGYRTTWAGYAVPVGAHVHPITNGDFEIRLRGGETGRVSVVAHMRVDATTRGGSISEGARVRQRLEIDGEGDPPF